MNGLISVCIPTYNRPELLEETLRSCLEQDYPELEILVGDDSEGDETRTVVERMRPHFAGEIVYFKNTPPLRQANNVNRLFDQAQGDRVLLLHDDDLLLPGAISALAKCWDEQPYLTAAYGRQVLINNEGETLRRRTRQLNRIHFRTKRFRGSKLNSLQAALVQQFPNNGYLLLTSAARRTRYRDEAQLGTTRWCDFEFSIRLALNHENFYFLDADTSKYRLTQGALSTQGRPTYMFKVVEDLGIPPESEWARRYALKRLAPIVITNHIFNGNLAEARRIYWSRHYPLHWQLRLSGVSRFLKMYGLLNPKTTIRHRNKQGEVPVFAVGPRSPSG